MLNHNQQPERGFSHGQADSRVLGANDFANGRMMTDLTISALNFVDSKGKGPEPRMGELRVLCALKLLESLNAQKVIELRDDAERIQSLEERRTKRIPEIDAVTKRYWDLERTVRGLSSSLQKQQAVAEASAQISIETSHRARNPFWHALYLVGERIGISGRLTTLCRVRAADAERHGQQLASTISALDHATERHEQYKPEYEARVAERVYLDSSIRNCCKSKVELENFFQFGGEAYRSSPLGAKLRHRLNDLGSSVSGNLIECLEQIEREEAALKTFNKRLGIAKSIVKSGSLEANQVFEVALAASFENIAVRAAALDFQTIGDESIWGARQRTLIDLLRGKTVDAVTLLSTGQHDTVSGGVAPDKENQLPSRASAQDPLEGKNGGKREVFDQEIEQHYPERALCLRSEQILSILAPLPDKDQESLKEPPQPWHSIKAATLGLSKPIEDSIRAGVAICLEDNLYTETEELAAFIAAMIHRNASPNQIKPEGQHVIELLGIAAIDAAEGAERGRHITSIEAQMYNRNDSVRSGPLMNSQWPS